MLCHRMAASKTILCSNPDIEKELKGSDKDIAGEFKKQFDSAFGVPCFPYPVVKKIFDIPDGTTWSYISVVYNTSTAAVERFKTFAKHVEQNPLPREKHYRELLNGGDTFCIHLPRDTHSWVVFLLRVGAGDGAEMLEMHRKHTEEIHATGVFLGVSVDYPSCIRAGSPWTYGGDSKTAMESLSKKCAARGFKIDDVKEEDEMAMPVSEEVAKACVKQWTQRVLVHHKFKDIKDWSPSNMWELQKKICRRCKVKLEKSTRCGQCKSAPYCSSACQRGDWEAGHRETCKDERVCVHIFHRKSSMRERDSLAAATMNRAHFAHSTLVRIQHVLLGQT